MTNFWKRAQLSPSQRDTAQEISRMFRLSLPIGQILVRRGLSTPQEVRAFLSPSLDDLHDPFLMKDMRRAVDRLNRALKRKEKIVIYGDFDVDGTTAVTLVYKYLRTIGCPVSQIDYYIPDRNEEGYGITAQGLEHARQLGACLIIALDCGIKAVDEVEMARAMGIDMIICDHHNPDDRLPQAEAILNPKQKDDHYPYTELSGCGVGYKFMQALAIDNDFDLEDLNQNLDLVAVSIASDIVSVAGENRILAYYGLKQLNSAPSFGLQSIINLAGLREKRIEMSDIVFKIGPRINASGRMVNGREAVDLLLAKSPEEAQELIIKIDKYNLQRRKLDKEITEEAIALLEQEENPGQASIIVLYQPDWHKGVIGIVASRIAEMYGRPTIILTGEDSLVLGSARSTGGFDMYRVLEACKDLLLSFGGHTYAAGMSLRAEHLQLFRQRIVEEAYRQESVSLAPTSQWLEIDAELNIHNVGRRFYQQMQRLSPFGVSNPLPLFLSQNVRDNGTSRRVGHGGEHLRLDLAPKYKQQRPISGFAFNRGADLDRVKSAPALALVYSLEESHFKGYNSVQLSIKDWSSMNSLEQKWDKSESSPTLSYE